MHLLKRCFTYLPVVGLLVTTLLGLLSGVMVAYEYSDEATGRDSEIFDGLFIYYVSDFLGYFCNRGITNGFGYATD